MSEIKLTSEITTRLVQHVGDDQMVVAAARVSTSGEDALKFIDKDANYGLIKYLISCRHSSVLEHSSMTFFVHTPIFIAREMQRHRTLSFAESLQFNEESARYKVLEPVFWIPRRDRKMKPVTGFKSARPEFESISDDDAYELLIDRMEKAYALQYLTYVNMINMDIAREVARAVLPVGIYSSFWVTGNLRGLLNFISLRTSNKEAKFISYPQAEIEEIAKVFEDEVAKSHPLVYKAFNECGRIAP